MKALYFLLHCFKESGKNLLTHGVHKLTPFTLLHLTQIQKRPQQKEISPRRNKPKITLTLAEPHLMCLRTVSALIDPWTSQIHILPVSFVRLMAVTLSIGSVNKFSLINYKYHVWGWQWPIKLLNWYKHTCSNINISTDWLLVIESLFFWNTFTKI